MATPVDRSDVAPPGPQWRWPGWSRSVLAFTGLALVLVLLAAIWVQARQFSLLRQAVLSGPEYRVISVYQAEFEYRRLLEQWRLAVDDRLPLDSRALQLRYDIWVSRIALLQNGEVSKLIANSPEDRRALAELQAFIARADQVLGPPPGGAANDRKPLTREFLLAELPVLKGLGPGIHSMTLSAAEAVALQTEARNLRVRQHNLSGLGLTIFLSLLTLAFAAVAFRQIRQAQERRKALEQLTHRLSLAQQVAETANKAKSEFLAHMSHEIRTPFHGLMGVLSLLRETGLSPQQSAYLRTATESADHLLAVLNDVLDLSQLESGRLRITPVPTDVRAMLRDIEALTRPGAVRKGLSFHLDIAPEVPDQALLDTMRLRQVLFNLLSNAVKFTREGAVTLDLRLRQVGEPSASVLEFVVSDTGPGMSAEELSDLFSGKSQGPRSRSSAEHGAGLGLEIASKLASAMGGELIARSQPDQGSSFTLRMPLQAAPAIAPKDNHAQPAPVQPTRALKVLVAEDYDINRQYMDEVLKSMGHHCEFASDGAEAVKAASENVFDLVLMDLHMPVMDGIAATRAIRALAHSARSTVPIIALTADAFEETRDRCMVAGMNGFLSKPLKPEMLATTLRRLFGPTQMVASRPVGADAAAAGAANLAAGPGQPMAEKLADPAPALIDNGGSDWVDSKSLQHLLQTISRQDYDDMAQNFFAQAPQTLDRLRAAVRDGQPLDLRANAHAAKGAAMNLCMGRLAATALALQQGASHLPAHEIARLVQRYEDQVAATQKALSQLGLLHPEHSPWAT